MIWNMNSHFKGLFFEKYSNNDKQYAMNGSLLMVFKVCYNIYIYY